MSSIDKYVINKVRSYDSSAYMVKSFGRIKCYIHGEKVLDIADRYGYLSYSESNQIARAMESYQQRKAERERELQRQREEERRRLEEERRRQEQLRKEAFQNLQQSFEAKEAVFQSNKAILEKQFHNNTQEIESYRNDINEVVKILPNSNLSSLNNKIDDAVASLNVKLEGQLNQVVTSINQLRILKSDLKSNMSMEEINSVNAKFNTISLNVDKMDITSEKNEIEETIKTAKEVANKISGILSNLNVIKDEFVKNEIMKELGTIDVFNDDIVKNIMVKVQNKIENYRLKMSKDELVKEVKELNNLESLAIGIKEFVTFKANDTYRLTSNRKSIIDKASTLIEELSSIASKNGKFINIDVASTLNELYNIKSNPVDIATTHDFLESCENKVLEAKDRFKDYEKQYDNFNELVRLLNENGKTYDQTFKYDDFVNQRIDLEDKIVKAIHEREVQTLEEASFLNVASMTKAGYQLYKKSGSEYYTENIFINKDLPGTVTRVLVTADGYTRISLIPVKIDDNVCKAQNILELSKKADEKIVKYLKDAHNNENGGTIVTDKLYAYDSTNALEKLKENGYFEIEDEGREIYSEMFPELYDWNNHHVSQSQENDFEKFNVKNHHRENCDEDKQNARAKSESQVMYQKFKS